MTPRTTHTPGGLVDKVQALELSPSPSPGIVNRTFSALSTLGLDLDLTLPTALSNLIAHLTAPLSKTYSPKVLSALRLHLTSSLTELYAPTWDTEHPQHGSGSRSLICTRELGLPRVLRDAAADSGVDASIWRAALTRPFEAEEEGRKADEWEAWCDPGTVVWRYGGWEYEDKGFEPFKVVREPFQIVWQASASPKAAPKTAAKDAATQSTPGRNSHAIPIRAPVPLPAVFAIPPSPANLPDAQTQTQTADADLLPAAFISRGSSPVHSDFSGYDTSSSRLNHSRVSSIPTSVSSSVPKSPSRINHRGTSSTSSNASSTSENSGATQLLTPGTRPPSTEPFTGKTPSTVKSPIANVNFGRTPSPPTPGDTITPGSAISATPTVTPYDGGNVTVLGGGVKLGGASRPASAMASGRHYDRSRSPSISLASRALSSALGPNGQPISQPRKARTRRRIMPTYLGHLGQPGVGGPVVGAFNSFGYTSPNVPQGPWTGTSVGVGVAPPPVPGMTRPLGGSARVSSI